MSEQFIQALVNGLVSGSIYALMAVGFTLVFGIMHVINLAHGELYMLGGFSTFFMVSIYHINFFVALVATLLIVGVLGFLHRENYFSTASKCKLIKHFISIDRFIFIHQ